MKGERGGGGEMNYIGKPHLRMHGERAACDATHRVWKVFGMSLAVRGLGQVPLEPINSPTSTPLGRRALGQSKEGRKPPH